MHKLLLGAVLLVSTVGAMAHDYKVGDLHIENLHTRVTRPGQQNAGAWITITNKGNQPESLIAVSSPIADHGEIHTMTMTDGVMKMREIEHLDIPAGQTLTMKPGKGEHLMLMKLKEPLKEKQMVPATLTFKNAGKVEVTMHVMKADADTAESAHKH